MHVLDIGVTIWDKCLHDLYCILFCILIYCVSVQDWLLSPVDLMYVFFFRLTRVLILSTSLVQILHFILYCIQFQGVLVKE